MTVGEKWRPQVNRHHITKGMTCCRMGVIQKQLGAGLVTVQNVVLEWSWGRFKRLQLRFFGMQN